MTSARGGAPIVRAVLEHLVSDAAISAATDGKYRRLLEDKSGEWGLDWGAITWPDQQPPAAADTADGGAPAPHHASVCFPFVVTPALTNAFGRLNGACVGAMVDTLTTVHLVALTGRPASVSTELRLTFIRPIPAGARAVLHTRVVRVGTSSAHMEAEVVPESDPGAVVVHAVHLKAMLDHPAASKRLDSTRKKATRTSPLLAIPVGRCADLKASKALTPAALVAAYEQFPILKANMAAWGMDIAQSTVGSREQCFVVRFPFVPAGAMLNPNGMLDGGVALEMLTMLGTEHTAAAVGGWNMASLNIALAYARPLPAGRRAEVRSWITKAGGRLVFLEAAIVDAADPGVVYVTATHIKHLFSKPAGPPPSPVANSKM